MSFCVSYNRLTKSNIKHIYSTKESRPIVRHFHRTYNPPTLSRYLSQSGRVDSLKRRLYEHDDEYGFIPRAPAFRTVSMSYVNDVVARLSQPNQIKLHPRSCKQYIKGFSKYKSEEEDPAEEALKTPREVKDMVERLNQPIVCRKIHYYRTTDDYEDDFELPPVSD